MQRGARVSCIALLAVLLAGCGQIKAHELRVFVLVDGTVSIEGEARLPSGEALIRVQNDSRDPARIVLAELSPGVDSPPVDSSGTVDVGSIEDLTYTTPDYRVLAKIDDLAPHFARGQTKNTIHLYLAPGNYALFSNFPGDVEGGRWVAFEVT